MQSVAEHAPKITSFLLEEEKQFLLPENFLGTGAAAGNDENGSPQVEITEKMRAYLVDWLAELHFKFKMWQETLYVTVGIIDRYLACMPDLKKSEL